MYLQEYSDTGRNKQLEHFLQMSLLHQSEKSGSNGSMDQMQIQHQQQHFISQFQRNVSQTVFFSFSIARQSSKNSHSFIQLGKNCIVALC